MISPRFEARRLAGLTPPQARAQLNNRIARAFLESDPLAFRDALAFNARLVTELRAAFPALWKPGSRV